MGAFIWYALVVMFRIKFNFDKSAVLTLSFYAISFLIKEIEWILELFAPKIINIGYLIWIDVFSTQMIVLNMYFFAFEMKTVYITIESPSYEEYQQQRK